MKWNRKEQIRTNTHTERFTSERNGAERVGGRESLTVIILIIIDPPSIHPSLSLISFLRRGRGRFSGPAERTPAA
jgi:hypothetical protein